MTLNNLLKDGINILKNNNIDNFEFDAREILLDILDLDLSSFLFLYNRELENLYDNRFINNLISDYSQLINYRAQNIPLQYILEEAYFLGFRFYVNESVLIPRFDTEILVEKVLLDNNDKNKTVLDMCTGSGCIAISLSKLGGFKTVVGSDISEDAIEVASKNVDRIIDYEKNDMEMQQQIFLLKSNMFEDLNKVFNSIGIDKFDIITVNPPYIKTKNIKKLKNEVKNYEPIIALDGGNDGLKYYRIIEKEAYKYLNINGKIYMEIGYDIKDEVINIFDNEKYKICDIVKDLNQIDRVIVVERIK